MTKETKHTELNVDVSSNAYRGDKEVLLACISNSPEFKETMNKHLTNERLWLERLTRNPNIGSSHTKKVIDNCANEISQLFNIKVNIAKYLIVTANSSKDRDPYQPKIISSPDNTRLYIEVKPETTKADIIKIWPTVKKLKKEFLSYTSNSKKSINPELAYCIHRQLTIRKRRIHDIFVDYINGKLDGYNHKPTITDESDFIKYYRRVVNGIKIG